MCFIIWYLFGMVKGLKLVCYMELRPIANNVFKLIIKIGVGRYVVLGHIWKKIWTEGN